MALDMDEEIYVLLNGAVASTCLLITCFFCFCLLVPKSRDEEGIKQPLLLLLWSVVGWNGLVPFAILLPVCLTLSETITEWEIEVIKSTLMLFSVFFSMSPFAWLSIFYYIRIVPAQRAFFMWMTRDIKPIIYWGLAIDRVFILSYCVTGLGLHLSKKDNGIKGQNGSVTSAPVNVSEAGEGIDIDSLMLGVGLPYVILCVIVMTSSSCATVLYLWKHIKRMQATPSSSSSSPQLQSQWRVTITGITQAGLYILGILWIFLGSAGIEVFDMDILCTGISFVSLGTMVNFGFGQTLFRQRAAFLWHRAVQITQMCGFNRAGT